MHRSFIGVVQYAPLDVRLMLIGSHAVQFDVPAVTSQSIPFIKLIIQMFLMVSESTVVI